MLLSRDKNSTEGMIIKTPSARRNPNAPKLEAPKTPANNGKYHIEIDKSDYTLSLFKGDELVKIYPVAVGKNPGDKQRVGDNRTPTGDFKIVSIENASTWSHNFRDGKGNIKGAYGPWFLRLDAKGWKGIGIHGTHDPNSLGTNATEGCIRLQNDDIAELKQFAYKNMPVLIHE
ncbi:MAG: L,D-transpeptidase [Synergistaceae bacterium]|nr:L,D-transpeptidase [Synergistaceae bacterium]